METLNNPAARLHKFLLQARQINGSLAANEGFRQLLDFGVGKPVILYRRLSLLADLSGQVIDKIKSIPGENHDLLLRQIPKIEKAFQNLNLHDQFAIFVNQIDDTVLYGLELCSDVLSKRMPEKTIKQDDLNKIHQEAEQLIDEINKSNIEVRLKIYIINQLILVLQAIEEYALNGVVNIENIVKLTIGQTVTDPTLYEETDRTKEGSKFWELMGRIAIIVTIAVGVIQIGEKSMSLLDNKVVTQPKK